MISLREGRVDMLYVLRGDGGCGCCRDRGNGSPEDGFHDAAAAGGAAAAALGTDGIRGTRSRWERC